MAINLSQRTGPSGRRILKLNIAPASAPAASPSPSEKIPTANPVPPHHYPVRQAVDTACKPATIEGERQQLQRAAPPMPAQAPLPDPESRRRAEIKAANAAHDWAKRRWPNSVARMLPLVIGAGEEITAEAELAGISNRAIRRALHRHTRRPAYLANMAAPNAYRVDLDGKPIEPVTPEHQQRANELLAAHNACQPKNSNQQEK